MSEIENTPPNPDPQKPETPNSHSRPPAERSLSIWRDMWLKPRAVIRQTLAMPAHWTHWLPAMVAGVAAVLETFALIQTLPVPASTPLPQTSTQGMLLVALLLGPLSGLLHVGIMAFLLSQAGRLFGGAVTPPIMRRGISLSLVPMAFSLVPVLFELWWRVPGSSDVLLMLSTGLRALLNIWTLLLLVMTVSELQNLNVRRAIATVASTILLMFVLVSLLQPR